MYSHPVTSMHLNISPSGLLILFLPALFSVSVGSYTLFLSAHILRFCRLYTPFLSAHILCFSRLLLCFCRLIYSVSLGSYSVSVASFTRFPYSSTHFLVWKCPFCPASRKVSSILCSSTFPTSFPLSIPRQSLRAIFFVSCHTDSTVPFHPASSPVLPCPHLVINRVLLAIPVHVGRLKAQ